MRNLLFTIAFLHRLSIAETAEFLFEFDTLPAPSTQLQNIKAMAEGPDGNLFVVDAGHHRVVKFSPQGKFLGEMGGPGRGEGRFQFPAGIARGKGFGLYVSDAENQRLVQIDERLNFISALPLGEKASDGVFYPKAVAGALDGSLFIGDDGDGEILRVDRNGHAASLFEPSRGRGPPGFRPAALAALKSKLYALDRVSGSVISFDRFGTYLGPFLKVQNVPEGGLSTFRDSLLSVADTTGSRLILASPAGGQPKEIQLHRHEERCYPGPHLFSKGRLFAVDLRTQRIWVFGQP